MAVVADAKADDLCCHCVPSSAGSSRTACGTPCAPARSCVAAGVFFPFLAGAAVAGAAAGALVDGIGEGGATVQSNEGNPNGQARSRSQPLQHELVAAPSRRPISTVRRPSRPSPALSSPSPAGALLLAIPLSSPTRRFHGPSSTGARRDFYIYIVLPTETFQYCLSLCYRLPGAPVLYSLCSLC